MSDQKDAERGRLAREVLDNPVYQEAYGLIEQGIIKRWRDSRDEGEQARLHQLLLNLDKVKQVMEGVMASGEVALKKLERENRIVELGRRLGRR